MWSSCVMQLEQQQYTARLQTTTSLLSLSISRWQWPRTEQATQCWWCFNVNARPWWPQLCVPALASSLDTHSLTHSRWQINKRATTSWGDQQPPCDTKRQKRRSVCPGTVSNSTVCSDFTCTCTFFLSLFVLDLAESLSLCLNLCPSLCLFAVCPTVTRTWGRLSFGQLWPLN